MTDPQKTQPISVTLTYDEWIEVYASLHVTALAVPDATLAATTISESILAQVAEAVIR